MRVHTLQTRRKLFIANIVVNLSSLRVTLMSIFEATPERKVLLQCIHSAFGDGDGFITLNAHLIFPASRPPPCHLSAARPGKNIVWYKKYLCTFMFVIFGRCWMADCCLHTPGSRPAGMIVKFVIYRFKVKKVQEDTIPKSFCTFFTIQSWLRQTWRPRPRPAPPSQDTEDFNTDYRSCFNESSDNNNTTELVMVTSSWQLVMEADIKKCRKNEKDLCVKFNSHCEKLEKGIRDADGKVPSLYTHAVSNLKESHSEHHCALWVFKWHWTENCWWQRWPIKTYWKV